MAEVKIKTEVAGRVCAIPAAPGASLSNGDEILLVEAMKMEIPVTATSTGKLKSVLVKVDDVVAEEQVVAIIEA
jgi:acetyl-CoA carboxylase biotin carboxyl carrier protein